MVRRMTETSRFALADAASSPAFSVDGQTIYHLRGSGMPQLWAMATDGSNERPLALLGEKVGFVRRAPKDDRLIFGIDAGGDERQQFWLFDDGHLRPLTSDGPTIHEFGCWSPDGTAFAYTANDRDEAHFDVHLHEFAASTRRLHCGVHQLTVSAWHPSPSRAAPAGQCGGRGSTAFAAGYRHGGGDARSRTRVPAASNPSAGPRTAAISWVCPMAAASSSRSAASTRSPARSRRSRRARRATSRHGRSLPTARGWRSSRTIAAGRGSGSARPAAFPRRSNCHPATRPTRPGPPTARSWPSCLAGPTQPPGIHLLDVASGHWRSAWQPEPPAHLRPFELVEWPSGDGRSVPGWMARPAGMAPEAGWPTVVWVHGGPASQSRATWRPDMQMLLDQGYAVLMPNVRGSTGYGRTATASDDGEARTRERRRFGCSACLAGWVSPIWTPTAIGIMGQSYGGFMVLAAITRYPSLWKSRDRLLRHRRFWIAPG